MGRYPGLIWALPDDHAGLTQKGLRRPHHDALMAQPHNNCSPEAPQSPENSTPGSPYGQEDKSDPGGSWPPLRNWLLVTSSPYVNPLPLNASQLSRWSPDTPHPLPWVQSSFPGSAQLFGSLHLGRVMSPSVITHPLEIEEGREPGHWAENICLPLSPALLVSLWGISAGSLWKNAGITSLRFICYTPHPIPLTMSFSGVPSVGNRKTSYS